MLVTILLGFVAILCYLHFWVYSHRPKNFPPGPSLMLPIFGNALQLGVKSYETSFLWKEKYGDIIGYRVGSIWMVVLNSPRVIRESFAKSEFSSRTGCNPFFVENVKDVNRGVIFSNGPTWVHNRQLVQKSLRDFAYANRTIGGLIMDEVKPLLGRLKATEGQEMDTEELFPVHILNITWSIVAGERFDHDDPKFLELFRLFQAFWESTSKGIGIFFMIFPELLWIYKRFPFLFPQHGNLFRKKLFAFFEQTIREHRDAFQVGQPRDMVDTLLEDAMNTKSDDDMDIIATLLDLFVAGMETTSTSLRWACYLLAMNPDAQEKIANELRDTISSSEVTLSDRSRLIYAEATMYEIHRVSSVAPIGTPRGTTTDVLLDGFRIPRDTFIIPNTYACMYSKEIWGDPENFRPERFISPDGKSLLKNNAWIPFGFGKRICVGEALARDELFLFLTNLVQNFRLSFPSHAQDTMTPSDTFVGGVRHPGEHRIVFRCRN